MIALTGFVRGLLKHVRRYQHDAFFGDAKPTSAVIFMVFTNNHACLNGTATIDNGFGNAGIFSYVHIGQNNAIPNLGIGVNLDIRKTTGNVLPGHPK